MFSVFFSKFILCQLGVILLCICCMLVFRSKYTHLFTVLTIYFSLRKHDNGYISSISFDYQKLLGNIWITYK